jgi:tetratricopeptide (TPR) repeat protein
MEVADETSVLGDFDAAEFAYFGSTTTFRKDGGRFIVVTESDDGTVEEFPVAYTFGVFPLQQYLVSAPGGRLQALPFTWDSRPRAEGGGRWYHLYPDEPVLPGDPLHWAGRSQNWNYMCAECHSTDLEVNYDPSTDSFDTTWAEIDVACEACHGPGSLHLQQAATGDFAEAGGFPVDLDDHGDAVWVMNPDSGIAGLSRLPMRPQQQPEACGRCHARRGVIAADYEYGLPLEDTHRVALLDDGLYYADGQINDEVYVYGSFVQSRMYRAGVTCSDCHDPHSQQLLTGVDEPDRVCAQCHLGARFDDDSHHRHGDADVGCVDCHMTAKVYMGVDARRDHSFRVPRPDLSAATGAPNACNACHADRTVDWAVDAAREWWGDMAASRPHFATALHEGRGGYANRELAAVADNREFPGIARGTALTLLSAPLGRAEAATVEIALADADPLVRRGALQALSLLPPERWPGEALALLEDPVRSVRVEAARLMAPVREHLRQAQAAAFERAAGEYREAQRAILSQPEAHALLGDFEVSLGNLPEALEHFRMALAMEPAGAATRINYADALRRAGDEAEATRILREGIGSQPESGLLRHALGLSLVRSQRPEDGLEQLLEAVRLEPGNSRYAYVAAIALNSMGRPDDALRSLGDARRQFPNDFDIGWALATILRDRGESARAAAVARELAEQFPDSQEAAALYLSLATDQGPE